MLTIYKALGSGAGASRQVTIQGIEFDKNLSGVYARSVNNIRVTRSQFTLGIAMVTGGANMFKEGITLEELTGFQIEENTFNRFGNVPNTVGIRIYEAGPYENRTYKNSFSGLMRGQWSQGRNRASNTNTVGLQFLCNTNANSTSNDIYIDQPQPINISVDGVRGYQGSNFTTAQNTFTQLNVNGPYSDIWNRSNFNITYYSNSTATYPVYVNTDKVTRVSFDHESSCPSTALVANEYLTPAMRDQLAAGYDSAQSAYFNLLYNYNQLIDGGNKPLLLQEIMTTWSQDAWQMRAELLAKAPYLSEDVLREAAMTDVMPQAMLLEVCLANPEATGNDAFIEFLGAEIPNPLPGYMLAMIIANRENQTPRAVLESGLADQSAKMALACDQLLIGLKTDSIRDLGQIRYWHNRRATLADGYALAETFLEESDFTMAESLVNAIPDNYSLTAAEEAEHSNYTSLFALRKAAALQGRNIMQLDSSEIAILHVLAGNNTGRSSAMARNILCFFYNSCLEEMPVLQPESPGRMRGGSNPKKVILDAYNKVSISPNPAWELATVTWELPLLEGKAELVITNAAGQEVQRLPITRKQGVLVLDTRNLHGGIYLYQITQNGSQLAQGKLAVVN